MIRRLLARVRNQRGFALPTVILIVALLTILLTSGLTRARVERQIAMATDETATAFTIAESGLQTYLGIVTARPPDGDSMRVNVPGGYANVVAHLVRQPADTTQRTLYLIRSTGVAINPDSGARAQATHTVAQFAEWDTGYILRLAALTAANGLKVDNGSSLLSISGNDNCGTTGPIPGVLTTKVTGPDSATVVGAPGIIEQGASAGLAIATQTLINWAGTLGDELVPDYTSFQNGSTSYPIQRVLGDLTLSGPSWNGSGLLVVQGDLLITSDVFSFDGIILVGGGIRFDGLSATTKGLVVSGLSEQFAANPQRSEIGGSGVSLVMLYDACEVEAALAPLGGLAGVRNARMDTWAY